MLYVSVLHSIYVVRNVLWVKHSGYQTNVHTLSTKYSRISADTQHNFIYLKPKYNKQIIIYIRIRIYSMYLVVCISCP